MEGEYMANYRGIRAQFFTSGDIMELSPLARLLFIGLWLEADREGRFVVSYAALKVRYLPADDADIKALTRELTDRNLVKLYEVDGRELGLVVNFGRHQKIHSRETESVLPPPPGTPLIVRDLPENRETVASDDESGGVFIPESGQELDGCKENKNAPEVNRSEVNRSEGSVRDKPSTKTPRRKPKRAVPDDFAPSEKHHELTARLNEDLPRALAINVTEQAQKFVNYNLAKDGRYADWDAAFNNWLRNQQKYSLQDYAKNPGLYKTAPVTPSNRPNPIMEEYMRRQAEGADNA